MVSLHTDSWINKKEKDMLEIGQPLPNFTLPSDTAGEISPAKLLGQRYIIFAYPKDDTYG